MKPSQVERASRKRRTTFMIDENDMAELEAIAQNQRVSLAWVIRDAIKRYLTKKQPLMQREWNLLVTWLVATLVQRKSDLTLADAAAWFLGNDCPDLGDAWHRLSKCARPHLDALGSLQGMDDLLPYLIDAHGPGSRLSVRRDPSTTASRVRRKAHGVFYTPADVVLYMVESALRPRTHDGLAKPPRQTERSRPRQPVQQPAPANPMKKVSPSLPTSIRPTA